MLRPKSDKKNEHFLYTLKMTLLTWRIRQITASSFTKKQYVTASIAGKGNKLFYFKTFFHFFFKKDATMLTINKRMTSLNNKSTYERERTKEFSFKLFSHYYRKSASEESVLTKKHPYWK